MPSWWGGALLTVRLGSRFAVLYVYFGCLAATSLLPCLAGVALLIGGWRFLAWTGPGIAFLVFMVPLPFSVEIALAHPLQRVATIASTFALQTLGFVAFSEGNVIRLGEIRIGVVEACIGLSMLVIFFARSTAACLLVRPGWPVSLLTVSTAVPIAL